MAEEINDDNHENQDNENQGQRETSTRRKDKSKTPMLDNFGKDLTKMAIEGKLEQVIGRNDEIDRVIQILSRKKKNNPVLVGRAGVGKCFSKDTKITMRNDNTGEVFEISVNDFVISLTTNS
jgi:ATP-dependent Clp protease ATP-binding subunit ClpA